MTTDVVRTVQAITIPEEIGVIREQWIASKREDLERARVAAAQLREAGATIARLRRAEERVTLLRKSSELWMQVLSRFHASAVPNCGLTLRNCPSR